MHYLPLFTVLIRNTPAQLFIFGHLSVKFRVSYVIDFKKTTPCYNKSEKTTEDAEY